MTIVRFVGHLRGDVRRITVGADIAFYSGDVQGPVSMHASPANGEGMSMHAVIRTYSGAGAKELLDVCEQRKEEVKGVIGSVTGLVSYSLFRTPDGGISVTVCQDKAGTEESVKKAADWISKNASNTGVSAPKVSEGTVIVQI